jgi:Uma2 family endonuclease
MTTDAETLTVRLPGRPLTLADVTTLAADDELHRYELDNGTLVVLPTPPVGHATLVSRLLTWLYPTVSEGLVLPGVGLRTGPTSGRCPDLLVLRREPPADTVWVEPIEVQLVIEVASPGSETGDRLVKPTEYARAGVPRYWLVAEENGQPTVHLHTADTGQASTTSYLHDSSPLDQLLAGDPPRLS